MENLFEKNIEINSTPTFVKKFYFLDYFYILLKSIESQSNYENVLHEFIILKNKYSLGESKYKKLTVEEDVLTDKQMVKFEYTFKQVLSESIEYDLVIKIFPSGSIIGDDDRESFIQKTKFGEKALREYEEKGKLSFNLKILSKMEEKSFAFYQLLKLCYAENISKNGLLIFPIYSGLKLGFDKSSFVTNKQVLEYSRALRLQLENDIKTYTKKIEVSLAEEEEALINKLKVDDIISGSIDHSFDSKKYNSLLGRFRKYWLNYFLKNIYGYEYSFDTFNIWVERAKQIGILHTTEFFPDFSGRIIYPTSIITKATSNQDFTEIFTYTTGEKLFIHYPQWSTFQESFIRTLQEEYYIIQKSKKTHFVNLLDLKERVCFKLKISGYAFDRFLEQTYSLNLQSKLNKIQISLEADKLPQETNAMYLKREPVMINGKLKNIIAINYN